MKFDVYSIPKCLILASGATIFVILSSLISFPLNVNGQFDNDTRRGFEDCFNGLDDDDDGLIDGKDSDCPSNAGEEKQLQADKKKLKQHEPAVEEEQQQEKQPTFVEKQSEQMPIEVPILEICDNGLDDDSDGLVDNQDGDCPLVTSETEKQGVEKEPQGQQGHPNEEQKQVGPNGEQPIESRPVEVCDNGIDDNDNGLVDSYDSDCPPPTQEPQKEKTTFKSCLNNGTGCSPQERPKVNEPLVGQCPNNETECNPQGQLKLLPAVENCTDNQTECTRTAEQQQSMCPNNITDCKATGKIPTEKSEIPQCASNSNATECQSTNLAPIASAGNTQEVSTNQSVTLNGLGSYDPDGNITSFKWVQVSGKPEVTLYGWDTIQPSFVAPAVSNQSILTFELTVSDDGGLTDTDSVEVSVNASGTIGRSENNVEGSIIRQKVNESENLGASIIDTDSQKSYGLKLLSYSVNGSEIDVAKLDNAIDFSLNSSSKVKVVPTNSSTQLEVTDMTLVGDDGSSNYLNKVDSDQWKLDSPKGVYSLIIDSKYSPSGGEAHYGAHIQVAQKETTPPIADAGEDQVVSGNVSVTLDGTKSSDQDGVISSYQWLQINDQFIPLDGVDTPKPTFISPSNLGKDANLTFRLIVTDNNGANDTDDVSILVKNTTLPKIEGNVVLYPVPTTMVPEQLYEFKGILNLSSIPDGSYIQIRNGNGGQNDELITFAPINDDGKFTAGWTAVPREESLSIYAAYVDVAGNVYKSQTYPLRVNEPKSNPGLAEQTNPTTSLPLQDNCAQKPCIEIWYNEWNKDNLNVYIMTNFQDSRTHMPEAKDSVIDMQQKLKHWTGYNNKWNFHIDMTYGFPPSTKTDNYPIDILIDLKQYAEGKCGTAYVENRKFDGYVYTDVFTNPRCDIDYATKHEVIHALGIGHTYHEGNEWDKTNDMLCSVEWYRIPLGEGADTCQKPVDNYVDIERPTQFDIMAIVDAYGKDGFEEPNNENIIENFNPENDHKYYCELEPLPCEPSTERYIIGHNKETKGNYFTGHQDKGGLGENDKSVRRTTTGKGVSEKGTKFDTEGKKTTENDHTKSTYSTFQPYRYDKLGISLKHPPDWKFASLKNGIQLIKEKNGTYVEIRKHNLESSNSKLKQYVFDDIKDRSSSRQDFEVLNITATTISGNLPAFKTEYTFLKTENQKDFSINGTTNKILRYWTFANGNAYTVAYVSESDEYDLYLPIALKIIDTLKINPQEKSVK